ncbi:response regulator [Geopseudomonas guangdongensis]|uniref:histidine kinase n=1 Tax=Geopseudomonas guangdongensis TaxID=1245526 RepID=A0A1H2GF00_9GAMM|nr:response regulator [Pseudomonas guangdongensis]SDU18099.1 PAS domain S-box-containing protein [Pseudomonas guangdongensis]
MRWTFPALFVVLELLLLAGFYQLWARNADEVLEAKNREKHSAYQAITQTYGRVSELMHDTLLNRPGIRHLFHQGLQASGAEQAMLRGRLLRTLWPDYRHMSRYNLVQLHFHDRAGRSYLRFHKPEMSGDDLLASRPSIRRVLETGQPTRGFENGKLFHGYRYVFPVRLDGELIGSVETSIDFSAIGQGLSEVNPGHEYSFWLHRDSLQARVPESTSLLFPLEINPDYALEDLQASLAHRSVSARPASQVELDDRLKPHWEKIRQRMHASETFALPVRLQGLEFAAVTFMPVSNLTGEQAGYLVGYGAVPELGVSARHYLLLAGLASLLLAALLLALQRQRRDSRSLENERQMFKSITDNMLEGLFVQNERGTLIYWNPALERLLGFTAQQLQGAVVHELIHAHDSHGDDVPLEACPIRLSTLRGETYYCENERFRTAGGQSLPVEVTCAPVVQKGRIEGSITVFRDMTQRLQMQAAQEEARRAAERSARMKSTFLANMSHEIRTPMNGVMGMLDLTLETALDPEQREYLEIAQRSGEMLLALLNDILDVSKVDAGHLELESVAFDLNEVVEHTAKLLAARAHQKRLELIIEVEPGLPRHVLGDPLRLRQVLLNLLGNAIKFTERGEVALCVGRSASAPGALCFAVRDTGIGIAPEAQQQIFDAFRQAEESTTRKYGGTGLGLALSRRLVELMGGEIHVSSTPGQGSRFFFDLLLPPQAAPGGERSASERAAEQLAGLGLLIVDDVLANRLIVERHAIAWGMQPHGFCNPLDALAWMQDPRNAGSVQLAVLDRMMPELDGLELARSLRRQYPKLRQVMLSSASDQLEAIALHDGLLDQSLHKPASPDALAYALLAALHGPGPAAAGAVAAPSAPELDLRERHVLLVEDHPVNRMLAQRLLAKHAVQLSEAEDGAQAVALIEAGARFDIILMDCQMPVMDGPTATREIRRLERERDLPRTPVLALTAHAGTPEIAHCRDAGMDEVLSKPYNNEQLLAAIGRLLASAAAPAALAPAAADGGETPLLDEAMLASLEEALGEDLHKVVAFFCASLPTQIAALQIVLRGGDATEIRRQAHTLKGSAGNLGALALATLAREIEQQAQQQQALDAALGERLGDLAERTLERLHQRYPLPA